MYGFVFNSAGLKTIERTTRKTKVVSETSRTVQTISTPTTTPTTVVQWVDGHMYNTTLLFNNYIWNNF